MPEKLSYISCGGTQVKLIALHFHAGRVGAKFARIDAQQDILDFGIFAIGVVGVAGGYHRQSQLVGDVDGAFQLVPLDVQVVIHDFDEVAIAENRLKPLGDFDSLLLGFVGILGLFRMARENSLETQPLRQMMPSLSSAKQFAVDAGLEIKAFQSAPWRPV